MSRRAVWLCLVVVLLAPAVRATAQAADEFELAVKPMAEVFFNYHYNASDYPKWDEDKRTQRVNGFNEFEVTRAFLGFKADITRNFSAKVVLDAHEWGPALLQYAWVNYRVLDAFNLRAGVVGTSWIGFLNWAYDYRYVQKTAYELWMQTRAAFATDGTVTFSRPASETDLGVALLGKFPRGYGSYQVGVYNGEGAANVEVNAGKACDLRVTVAPAASVEALKDLSLSIHARYEKRDTRSSTQVGGLLHMRYAFMERMRLNVGLGVDTQFTVPFHGARGDDRIRGEDLSFFLDLTVLKGLGLFFRFDYFDPDLLNNQKKHGYQDEHMLLIGGVSYAFRDDIAMALDYQGGMYTAEVTDDHGNKTSKAPDQVLFVNWKFGF